MEKIRKRKTDGKTYFEAFVYYCGIDRPDE
jgi:hypothetical protein